MQYTSKVALLVVAFYSTSALALPFAVGAEYDVEAREIDNDLSVREFYDTGKVALADTYSVTTEDRARERTRTGRDVRTTDRNARNNVRDVRTVGVDTGKVALSDTSSVTTADKPTRKRTRTDRDVRTGGVDTGKVALSDTSSVTTKDKHTTHKKQGKGPSKRAKRKVANLKEAKKLAEAKEAFTGNRKSSLKALNHKKDKYHRQPLIIDAMYKSRKDSSIIGSSSFGSSPNIATVKTQNRDVRERLYKSDSTSSSNTSPSL